MRITPECIPGTKQAFEPSCGHPGQGVKSRFVTACNRACTRIAGLVIVLLSLTMVLPPEGYTEMKRFYFSGDGFLHLKSRKNGKTFNGRYRDGDQRYIEQAYQKICAVFGAPYDAQQRVLSLRLIEYLDFLGDRMGSDAVLTITSGYRAPEYNKRLRKGGALAAKASLHQYGMAADLIMDGVSSERVWHYVRELNFGGTGYYHGKTVHVDVGPARYWDEKSSGVGTGLSDDNKLIGLVTDYDRYAPGDWITLKFIRMTAFPIMVHTEFSMIHEDTETMGKEAVTVVPDFGPGTTDRCRKFDNIRQMAFLRWQVPATVKPGRYTIHARFCESEWKQMPNAVNTPEFEVRTR